jgi:hypothetical protein
MILRFFPLSVILPQLLPRQVVQYLNGKGKNALFGYRVDVSLAKGGRLHTAFPLMLTVGRMLRNFLPKVLGGFQPDISE